jgi:trk system potassium uptake protein TrkH
MQYFVVVGLVGRLSTLFGLLMAVPLLFSWAQHDGASKAFVISMLITISLGLAMILATRRFGRELQPRDGFLLVGATWMLLPAFGSLPMMLGAPHLSYTDAYFEAMSGFTTTGATLIVGLDSLPVSINIWRCLLVLIGGMGIIVLVVAILPLLGVGGSQLFRAETAGPLKETKLTPRIEDTARGLWTVYFGIATACFFAYWWAGMDGPDAFMHMCSTMGLGGFSSHDQSFAYWNSELIEAVAVIFMAVAGVNFALYFLVVRRRDFAVLLRDAEVRAYASTLTIATVAGATYLYVNGTYETWLLCLRNVSFNLVSVATTTGFASVDYAQWPEFLPASMLLLGSFATCAGSTGGGIKMVRFVLLVKQVRRELIRIAHPKAVIPIVYAGNAVDARVMQGVIAFMMFYGALLTGLSMALVFSGLDLVTSFSAVMACMNNIGPGLGQVGPAGNYANLTDLQTWICTIAMLLGRLELLSVLVLLTPQFWRR